MTTQNTITKTYEVKIKANKSFKLACDNVLLHCQRLYNACLEQRISYYQYQNKSINWIEQSSQITELREAEESYRLVPRNIQTDVVKDGQRKILYHD